MNLKFVNIKQLINKLSVKYLFAIIATIACLSTFAQTSKKIESVYVQLNDQHPDEFILEDEAVKITFKSGSMMRLNLQLDNKLDQSINVIWKDSYFVINGNTTPADNVGLSKASYGLITTTAVDNNAPQKVAPKAGLEIKSTPVGKQIFNYTEAKNYFKKNEKPLENRFVLTLSIDGKMKEYPIKITNSVNKQ